MARGVSLLMDGMDEQKILDVERRLIELRERTKRSTDTGSGSITRPFVSRIDQAIAEAQERAFVGTEHLRSPYPRNGA